MIEPLEPTRALEKIAELSRRDEAVCRQRQRRLAECRARRSAVEASAALEQQGHSGSQAARRLRLNPRTLNYWKHRHADDELAPVPRGRPCHEDSGPQRLSVLNTIAEQGPHLGVPTLRSLLPDVRRCQLVDLQTRFRHWYRQHHRITIARLTWHIPGAVWAIDHTCPPRPVDGRERAILAIRDLASGFQIAWRPVADQTADTTLELLSQIIDYYGPPLVLKSDNGSAFKSRLFSDLLDRHRIVHLRSPAYTPGYNGSCEAGIGAMKLRTGHFAQLSGDSDLWTRPDLNLALHQANHIHRTETDPYRSAYDRWSDRPRITPHDRSALAILIADIHNELITEARVASQQHNERNLQRTAIANALVLLRVLSIYRRPFHPPLILPRLAKIS